MLRFLSFFCALFLFSSSVFSQEKWSVVSLFDKVEKQYQTRNYYSYVSDYKFYETNNSKKIVESYSGAIIKKDKVSYQMVNNIEFVDFGDYNVMVSQEEKIVQVSKIEKNDSPIALQSFLKVYPNRKISENKLFWICELSSKKLTQSPFEKVSIYISKKDFSISKQVFYVQGEQEYELNNKKIKLVNPRLEIVFTEKAKDLERDTQRLSQANYFSISNKKINLSKRFKTYKLITF